jgi:NitT/TauT family transport system ATP-binding protein
MVRASEGGMSAIVFDRVWKEYGDHIVLEQIDLKIEPRAFLALVGPSGCGKTTFLRLLLGEERPTRGAILLEDKPLKAEPDSDRGVVFQRYSVFPHLTALENVLIGREFEASGCLGRLFGAKRRAAKDEARALLAEVGLAGQEEKYPVALSGGMQQRLALAQALIRKPKVLLLDEPFGALDPGIRADIHVLMRRIWNDCDLTVVMVTHDLREAFELATRVIAFERPRDRPEERERYGARLSKELASPANGAIKGATVTKDIEIWPRKIAGSKAVWTRHGPSEKPS